MAFKKYNPVEGIWASEWCGLENFEFFFTSQDAVRVIRNIFDTGFDCGSDAGHYVLQSAVPQGAEAL